MLEGGLGEVVQGVVHGREGSFRADHRADGTETALSSTTPFRFAIQATAPPGGTER